MPSRAAPAWPVGPPPSASNQDVELVGDLGGQQRLPHDGARRFAHEIIFERPPVDRDLALARSQKHPRDRGLAAARSQMLY